MKSQNKIVEAHSGWIEIGLIMGNTVYDGSSITIHIINKI